MPLRAPGRGEAMSDTNWIVVDADGRIVNDHLLNEGDARQVALNRTRFPINHRAPFTARQLLSGSPIADEGANDALAMALTVLRRDFVDGRKWNMTRERLNAVRTVVEFHSAALPPNTPEKNS